MVVIDERSNTNPLENFYFKFEPMLGASSWYPGVITRSPNGSDGSYIGEGRQYFLVKYGYSLPDFIYILLEPLPNYLLSLSDIEQMDDKITLKTGFQNFH